MPGYDWMWWGPLTNQNLVQRCAEVHIGVWRCITVCPWLPLVTPSKTINLWVIIGNLKLKAYFELLYTFLQYILGTL